MRGADTGSSGKAASAFETTRWTLVLHAGNDDRAGRDALADLCRAYWLPLFVYMRRRGYSAHDAEDHVQEFFAQLLARDAVKRADRARGRFRTFLLTAFINHLHNAHDHARAERRGGAVEKISFDAQDAAPTLAQVEDRALSPDQAFDRSWTLALFDRALRKLHAEQARAGKERWFERVRPFLQARPAVGDYAALAAESGQTKNAVAVGIHRLASRYRELVRAEIRETVSGPEEFEGELRELLGSLKSR